MEATFNLPINILDEAFLKKIKTLFSNKAIVEFKVIDNALSETDYLLSIPENKEILRKSISQLQENKIINKNLEDLLK